MATTPDPGLRLGPAMSLQEFAQAMNEVASSRQAGGVDNPTLAGLNERVAFTNELLAQLCGIASAQEVSLRRLVALEEERREGERGMEALAQSLMPGNTEIDVDQIDWFRDRDGTVRVHGSDGDRSPTQEEAAALQAIGALAPRRRGR